MNRFDYVRAGTVAEAVQAFGAGARFIAGGTNLIDLMKYEVEKPGRLIDITHLPLDRIEAHGDGLRIGALVTNAKVAYDDRVTARYPLLRNAILAGASAQLRNAASTGGNLLQRTRCYYFYDVATPCNKRAPGSGCPAIGGMNRIHAIFGTSDKCIATHPSDMCIALAALEATVQVNGPQGERSIPFSEFHRLPGESPETDTNLAPGEIVVSVDLPESRFPQHFTYLKLRDRLSYAFALVSVAAGLELDGDRIKTARLALGGVAHKPWRNREAEALLEGKPATRASFQDAADLIVAEAKPQSENGFKIDLARRAIVRGLEQAAAGTPQSLSDKRIQ
ncbi:MULTISPECIES: xanthine dehydrogenase family protein subunit M [Methylobacterium]|jgi:xanthine dehydrogenase YagS FAD-binding subunit|uniref:Xanthine dehydrogenase YagS FAD-binding subunit n=2 Tax=Methylobacterium TaxID=407 RepID=A0AAE8L5H3_9HYPH|nr:MULTISPECIES: xanthine dehydrogenase family protein subunit M [Methylobacterium]KOX56298.1 FAD-binding molybdopterin dehydrogenase [Streptomyces purpurogeneiscleroticus]APT33284.1 putative xanthine dehydrogenase YagS FAD-binding subunit [Methylobacterium phyllosphaerae]MBA9061588.1 xanthine dehydrogenase YagS FAD-binding subunit [Methylobacterium fujisawaense]MBP34008.1 xanthine dehydrogenase family protein subunit M [Methylobacterium sp.]MDE4910920.1 xanthine dehydrogenase family protein s